MKLEKWVLFIDMLGYGNITGKIKNDKEAENFISFMKYNEILLNGQSGNKRKEEYKKVTFDLYEYYDIQVTFISDSLVINYKPLAFNKKEVTEDIRLLHSANALIIILSRLQTFITNCLYNENKILLRGGISNKYCKIVNNFAVGEGVIEAYQLESKIAIYPRIVISSDITNNTKLIKALNYITQKIYNIDTFITTDYKEIAYLDYLKYHIGTLNNPMMSFALITTMKFFLKHKNVIEEKLLETSTYENSSIKEKFLWLKEYHNNRLSKINKRLIIQ